MLAFVVRKSSNLTIAVVVFRGFQCPCVVSRGLPWSAVVFLQACVFYGRWARCMQRSVSKHLVARVMLLLLEYYDSV